MQFFNLEKNKKDVIAKLAKPIVIKRVNSSEKTEKIRVKGVSRASVYRYKWYVKPLAQPKKGRDTVANLQHKMRIANYYGRDYKSFYEDGCNVSYNGEHTTGLSYNTQTGEFKSKIKTGIVVAYET